MGVGYSLHIGLNSVDPDHYAGWDGRLKACEADARDVAEIAKSLGYQQTELLLTKDATSANVIRKVLDHAKTLRAGDILLLSYAGHGGQMPDTSNDEDDKRDETWCLYDRELIDDEIYRILGRFRPGVRIVMLSDSCHSGTVARARVDAGGPSAEEVARRTAREAVLDGTDPDDVRPRMMPFEVAVRTFERNSDLYVALQSASAGADETPPQASVILLSGCMDHQLSLDGARNGLFTATLLKVWADGGFDGGYNRFHQDIVSRMPPGQTPNLFKVGPVTADFMNQKPFSI